MVSFFQGLEAVRNEVVLDLRIFWFIAQLIKKG